MWSVRTVSFLFPLYPSLAAACDDPAFLFDNKRLALRLWVINLPVILVLGVSIYRKSRAIRPLFQNIAPSLLFLIISPGWRYSGMSGDCALEGLHVTAFLLVCNVIYAYTVIRRGRDRLTRL